jgi:D-aminopeptidase
VQANFGKRDQLTIAGVPVGRFLEGCSGEDERGSIIGIVATDAPLLPHQLKRLARRIGLGIGRSGSISGHGSGDIFMAFSTANESAFHNENKLASARFIPNPRLDRIFEAVIQSVDEAILNAMIANNAMEGFQGSRIEALPLNEVIEILRKHKVLP